MYSFVIPRINMSKMSENQTRHKWMHLATKHNKI
jgi:hypothetical protein